MRYHQSEVLKALIRKPYPNKKALIMDIRNDTAPGRNVYGYYDLAIKQLQAKGLIVPDGPRGLKASIPEVLCFFVDEHKGYYA